MKKLIFIAHRGAPLPSRRSNTVSAFERAAESERFDYIEFDIWRTRTDEQGEKVTLVADSENTNKLYESQKVPKRKRGYQGVELSDITYDMLKSDALEVATLKETLRVLNGHSVILEIDEIETLEQTLTVIKDFIAQSTSKWKMECFTISSHSWDVLRRAKELTPEIHLMMLCGLQELLKRPIRAYKELKADSVNTSVWTAPVLLPILAAWRIPARYVYSVNNYWLIWFYRFIGATGIATDTITIPDSF